MKGFDKIIRAFNTVMRKKTLSCWFTDKKQLKSLIEKTGRDDKDYASDDVLRHMVNIGIILVGKGAPGTKTRYWYDAKRAREVLAVLRDPTGFLELLTEDEMADAIGKLKLQIEAGKKAAEKAKTAKTATKQQDGPASAGQEDSMTHRRLKRHSAFSVDVTDKHPRDWGKVVALFTQDSAETGRLGDGKTVRALIANAVSGTLTGQEKNSYMLAALNSCIVLEERDGQGEVIDHVFDHHQNEAVAMSMLLPRTASQAAEMVIKEPTLEEIAELIAELDREREEALGIGATQRSGLKAVPKPKAAPAAPEPKAAPAPEAPAAPAPADGQSLRQRMEASLRSKRDAILASSEDAVALNDRLGTVRADRDAEAGRAGDLSATKQTASEAVVAARARVAAAEEVLAAAETACGTATAAESAAGQVIAKHDEALVRFDTIIESLGEQIAEVALTPEQQAAVERLDTLLEPAMLTEAYGPE
ncbi:MAG TPA: hypothetical protein QF873_02105 [Patescibacteria group bacterium]|nr:hypothetical protein [Patescibacteria group bacterium]